MVTVRPAREQDVDAIVAVLNPIIEAGSYTTMADLVSASEQLEFMRRAREHGVYNVAVDGDVVVGIQDVVPFSGGDPALAHLGAISTFVTLDARGAGIGRALANATFDSSKQRGFRKLMATIRADNPGAISYYQGIGFQLIGTARQHALVRGRYLDEVLAERLL
jgi:L-amino acid N-acyltransferase YncA